MSWYIWDAWFWIAADFWKSTLVDGSFEKRVRYSYKDLPTYEYIPFLKRAMRSLRFLDIYHLGPLKQGPVCDVSAILWQ
jgi:hypothetical protein